MSYRLKSDREIKNCLKSPDILAKKTVDNAGF